MKLKLIADKIKELKKQEDEIKKAILEEMENKNILKIDTDEVSISYIASSDRETFDTKKFREEHSDLYDEFVKFTPVKSSIRVKVKD
jgi:predicted phage-related endonuclease